MRTKPNASQVEVQDRDIIELGAISVDTMGPEPGNETMGGDVIQGISDQ